MRAAALRGAFGGALAGVVLAAPGWAQDGPDLSGFVGTLAACLGAGDRPLELAVVGLPSDQTALGEAEAEELRLRVEEALEATGAVRLSAGRDLTRLRALQAETAGLSEAEVEAGLRRAFGGDAAVFAVAPRRTEDAIAFRLQAIAGDAGCKATSAALSLPLWGSTTVADAGRAIDAAVDGLVRAAPEMEAVTVCPVEAEGGRSECAGPLTDLLADALAREGGAADRALSGRDLRVERGGAACAAGDGAVTATGRFAHDAEGRSWLGLEFRRGEEVLAALPRARVSVAALGCDPATRGFLDHVATGARSDRGVLDLLAARTPFAEGDRLDIRLDLGAPAHLYCWVLAPDETAFVALPAGAEAATGPGVVHYPADFGLGDVVLSGAFENLFHCFASARPLPPEVDARWREAGPGGEAALLDAEAMAGLLQATRAAPGVVEAAARVVVR